MSTSVTRSLNITDSNATTYLTAESGIDIPYEEWSTGEIWHTTSTSAKYGTFSSAALNVLYPNDTAKPTSISITDFKVGNALYLRSHTVYGYLVVNGTTIASATYTGTAGANTMSLTSSASSVISQYNKSNVVIKLGGKTSTSNIGASGNDDCTMTLTFTRYDFSASAGDNISSASVSASTGYDGDTITYSCSVNSGCTFAGWYNGSTLVSSSQTYTHTVSGADVTLTAKATVSTKTLTATYNGSTIINEQVSGSVSITYNGSTITTFSSGTKTLTCNGEVMSGNVVINGNTLPCSGKVMASNVVVNIS